MTTDRADDVLADLDNALQVSPSEGFERRVRQAVASEPARWRRVWPLAAAAAILLVGGMIAVSDHTSRQQRPVVLAVTMPADGTTAPEPVRTASQDAPASRDSMSSSPGPSPAARAHVPVPVRRGSEPEVLVSSAQAAAFAQFVDTLRAGKLDPAVLPDLAPKATPDADAGGGAEDTERSSTPGRVERLRLDLAPR
jgi:hypothetical protein